MSLLKHTCWKVLQAYFRSASDVRSWAIESFGNRLGSQILRFQGKSIKIDVINNIPYLSPSETEVVAGRSDLPRVYRALPAPIVVHEKVVAVGESHHDEADALGELDLDMPREAGQGSRSRADESDHGSKSKGSPPSPEPRARDLRAEAKSFRHLMTHLPKNPYCDACQRAKMENASRQRSAASALKVIEKNPA